MSYNVFSGTLNPTQSIKPMPVAQSSSRMLTIGCIAYQWEGVTGVHSAGKCDLRLPCLTL